MSSPSAFDIATRTADLIRARIPTPPRIGLVLGSGLGGFANQLQQSTIIPYSELPAFPRSSVEGHAGNLVIGTLHGLPIAAMQGRVHRYEGFTPQEVVLPIRVLRQLGVRTLIVTNAAGGIQQGMVPGDLTVITDHLNLTGDNPLVGLNDERFGPRFPDVSRAWTPALRQLASSVAQELGLPLRQGVYAGMLGPTYETPAEVRMIRTFGGDMVGMSTVYEAIAAAHMGMRLLGISCITNMAAGIEGSVLDHEDVQAVAAQARDRFQTLLDGILKKLAREDA